MNVTSEADSYAGGIAGYIYASAITNCYATGDVSASTSGDFACVGGIAGEVNDCTITNCYRYEGQTIIAKKGASNGKINTSGTLTTLSNLQSQDFITETLDWGRYVSEDDREIRSNNVWQFKSNKFPTLWFAK